MPILDLDPLMSHLIGGQNSLESRELTRAPIQDAPLVILSNRLPVTLADIVPRRSVSGLTSSIEAALLGSQEAIWIGWHGGPDTVSQHIFRAAETNTTVIGTPIKTADFASYYSRVCNSYLLPNYCGTRVNLNSFEDADWESYVRVNEHFANLSCERAAPRATVWVNDFHLQLCPRIIKLRRPDLRVIYFHHIKFPNPDIFSKINCGRELLLGLAAADRIGFQSTRDLTNFQLCLQEVSDVIGDSKPELLTSPAEIDFDWWVRAGENREILESAVNLRSRLGSPDHIMVGVDRYADVKGVREKFRAFGYFSAEASLKTRVVLLQVAAVQALSASTSTGDVTSDLESLLLRSACATAYLSTTALSRSQLAVLYACADSVIETPLADGMNLVVKEFVAAKGWNRAKLIVSRYAGVAEDLPGALLVDPSDAADVERAMDRLVSLPLEKAQLTRAPRFVRRNAKIWMQELLD